MSGQVSAECEVRLPTAAELGVLATTLAPLPLLQRYGRTAEALQSSWAATAGHPQGQLRAAFAQQAPVGLCVFSAAGTFGAGAYLQLLAVAAGAQGRGVGGCLLTAFEAAVAPGARGCFLLCSSFNLAAQAFYRRHGYAQVGVLPDYIRAGIDEHIYFKPTPRRP